jgi:hypothetical protein
MAESGRMHREEEEEEEEAANGANGDDDNAVRRRPGPVRHGVVVTGATTSRSGAWNQVAWPTVSATGRGRHP